jgi:heme/copper-type cytochrome/quinol oxidase subunit 2
MKTMITAVALALLLPLALDGARAADAPAAADTPFVVPVDPDGVQRTTVTLDSYYSAPSHLVVEAGKPVELTLVSESTFAPHDFVIDDPASGLSVKQNVGSGKTVKVGFTPQKTGRFAFYCSKKAPFSKSHREKGMEGVLEVTG